MSTFLECWQHLLPASVRVIAGSIIAPSSEHLGLPSKGNMGSERTSEFYTGRLYAKEALGLFGVQFVDLQVGDDRRPVWPAGYIGSITHTRKASRGFCAAAVARDDEWRAIGIDAEFSGTVAPQAWPSILTEGELRQIKALPPNDRAREVTRRWCIKESTVKAAKLIFEPLALETIECEAGFRVLSHANSQLSNWRVKTATWDDLVCAAVVAS
jgi:4'-phosphopantetheinyl transferase EntD